MVVEGARGRSALSGAVLIFFALLLGIHLLSFPAARAQDATATDTPTATTLPEPLTHDALRDLVARLSDTEVRRLLLAQLDRDIAAAARADQAMIGGMDREAMALRESWGAMLAAVPALPGVPMFFADQLIGDRSPTILLWIALGLVGIFAVGVLAEQLYRRAVRDVRRQVYAAQPAGAAARVGYCLLALLLDFIGIVVFALATIAAFFVLHQGHVPVRLTAMTWIGSVFAIRLVALFTCALLAPDAASLRILPVDDRAAHFLYRRIMRIAIVWALVFPTLKLMQELGLDRDVVHLLINLGIAVVVALLIGLIWQGREPVARLIRGTAQGEAPTASMRVREILARVWHILAILYVLGLWGLTEVSMALALPVRASAALGSLLLVVALPLADAALRGATRAFVAARDGGEREAYGRVGLRAGRILLVIVAVVFFGWLWGIDLFDMAAGGLGERLVATLVDVGLTLLVAYVGWELAKTAIDRRLALEEDATGPSEHGGEGGGQGASRLKTLLPLFRKFLMVTLAVMVVMLVLSSLGVDIGPLLAGAGVVGIAIGFGAQTLVRDIVSGVFFLLDDAFRLGEYIDIGGIRGTVEQISIRSLRLRHHRGALHTVPFGEIQHLTNHSRDWVIMKLTFRVPYDTDLAKVKKIFKKIGAEMAADPVMGPNLLDPPKSQGVLEIDDSAMIIRCKFMAKPGEQFIIRRELFQRVQQEFEAAGIHFARRQVSVYVPPTAPGEAPDPQAAAAAAAAAQEQEEAAKKRRAAS
jgi:moderate conductance mechanosensitive channel